MKGGETYDPEPILIHSDNTTKVRNFSQRSSCRSVHSSHEGQLIEEFRVSNTAVRAGEKKSGDGVTVVNFSLFCQKLRTGKFLTG